MKKTLLVSVCATALLVSEAPAAVNFPDATGDFTPSGFGYLDITSVVVDNDATTLSFQIHLAGNPLAVDWAKYLIGLDTAPGGNTTGPDGWGKPISMSVGGMDYFIGSWMNFGTGAELRHWDGSAWPIVSGSGITVATGPSSVTLSLPLASLGVNIGDTLRFDVYTTSDGNSVLDAAGSTAARSWNNDPYDSGNNVLSYTLVPEPTLPALLGLGAVLWLGQRRRAGRGA
ncbi:PEP-CTERM sorting domain-containing protein [Limisphaera sp. VF-2]|jgi:hypothetical protein|uniref:PEP-CTERM sorting domain-containing protein n=1 Tax=Limisphaera sp. VF-2 TaxID=3400418 RepID=UPI0017512657|nr:PEP-CTERM sorting domain-containing protein [Limisphaera sp.]